jgi:para-nitrobenzyl esterase
MPYLDRGPAPAAVNAGVAKDSTRAAAIEGRRGFYMRLLARVFFSLIFATDVAYAAQVPAVAHLTTGTVTGMEQGGIAAFLGIPFAAPPVGPDRWRAPQPVKAWQGTRDATHFAASCYQALTPDGFGPWKHEYVVQGEVSEDCLYLNVWTAKPDAKSHRPVLVWIHGGGFTQGSGSVAVYDGAALASDGIVVVTLNYRMGAFGFLAHPELTHEAGKDVPPGNFGLQDMIAALKWVRTNIATLGGDPEQVTLDGQSAGAMAIHDLLASPLAAGLFKRAIIESGLPNIAVPHSLPDAERAGEEFQRSRHAASLVALRALPAAEILGSSQPGGPRFGPIIDGVLLPDAPTQVAKSGKFNDTPVMIGMVADEASGLAPAAYASADQAGFTELVHKTYGPMAERFQHFYPATTDAERLEMSHQLLRDKGLAGIYAWGSERLARSRNPIYVYLFTHVEPGPDSARYAAFHSCEIPYAFRTLDKAPERNFTAADRTLAHMVSAYWVNFVKTGDPNGHGLAAWPRFEASNPRILKLDVDAGAQPLLPEPKLEAARAFLAQGGDPSIF